MARWEVTLHIEQDATLVVEAPEDATEQALTNLALRALDDSGGDQWATHTAWSDTRRLED